MPLTFSETLGMLFRSTPVPKIRKALAMAEDANLAITARELEAHYLCGRDPLPLVDALMKARQLGVDTNFQEISAVILAGHDPFGAILEASKEQTKCFDTFSPDREDKLRGFTKDQHAVSATITATFRLSPAQIAFTFNFRPVHQRLGAETSIFINTATSRTSLIGEKPTQEDKLTGLGREMITNFKSVTLEYR